MSEVPTFHRTAAKLRGSWVLGAVLLLTAACAAVAPPDTPPGSAPSPAPAAVEVPPPAAAAALTLHSMEVREAAVGTQLVVATSGPLVWTSYRDAGGDLVIELPNSRPAAGVSGADSARGLVESARIEVEDGGERPLTRVVVRTRGAAEHSVAADGERLLVDLMALDPPVAEREIADLSLYGDSAVLSEPLPDPEPAWEVDEPGTPSEPLPGPAPSGAPATQLQGVEVSTEDGGTVVWVLGDGEFYYSTFALENPERFVVDLNGVSKTVPYSAVPVGSEQVDRVRIAQFRLDPELIARVVIDLPGPASPEVEPTAGGLRISFGGPPVAEDVAATEPEMAMEPEAPAAEPAAAIAEGEEADWSSRPEDEAVAALPEPAPEPVVESAPVPKPPLEPVMPPPAMAEAAPAPAVEKMPAPEVPKPAVEEAMPPPAVEVSPPPAPEPVLPQEPFNQPARDYPTQVEVAPEEPAGGLRSYETRSVDAGERAWSGEPVTFTLKDADIKDVLRTFAQLSGLNIVVQPGVTGTVTVELTNVPWDQALEQILKINGLDYQLEGNIMRIAPTKVLQEEAQAQLATARAQALSIPLRTIMRRVSYGSATEIASVLRSGGGASVLSQRGSVVVDQRTNTLIIKELPSIMNTVIAVIDNLDVPEPQVIIEARIIETTKRFTRTLGIQWGFDAIASAATGNTTGLQFPNNIDAGGGVQLLTGGTNGFLGLTLGNVLNTFQLDAVLQAAENEGLINILSAPKITTLNNERATIQSGLQIPIQTIANNTVSVQFINATLRLDVVPHVTAAGTVLMDIDIQKREPQLAFAVAGAQNAPISTKDARTRVIVRDGGTTVIGGIYEVTSDQGEDRVPGLSSIPILKHLFKNQRRTDENEELLIFITPRVVKL